MIYDLNYYFSFFTFLEFPLKEGNEPLKQKIIEALLMITSNWKKPKHSSPGQQIKAIYSTFIRWTKNGTNF